LVVVVNGTSGQTIF